MILLGFNKSLIMLYAVYVILSLIFSFFILVDGEVYLDYIVLSWILLAPFVISFEKISNEVVKQFYSICVYILVASVALDLVLYATHGVDVYMMLNPSAESGRQAATLGPLLRVRSFFNEPGILALFVISLVYLGEQLKASGKNQLLLLIVLFNTFSPVMFLIAIYFARRHAVAVLLFMLVLTVLVSQFGYSDLLLSRLSVDYLSTPSGIERKTEFLNALSSILQGNIQVEDFRNITSSLFKLIGITGFGIFLALLILYVRFTYKWLFAYSILGLSIKGYFFPGWLVVLILTEGVYLNGRKSAVYCRDWNESQWKFRAS